ncbi:hypothetical protein ATCCBAA256_02920 [Mycobacterium montefiorense]|nr:hypothetical protein ATCCBAA256_02920 [Mycobacterium montefiorense]
MCQQLDLVGHHERRVEADTELTDQLLRGRLVLGLPKLLAQLGGARLGQRADQTDDLVARHADAVVADGQRAGVFVHVDLDVEVRRVDVEILVAKRLKPKFVQCVRSVRDQLPQKRVLVGVDRVDHQIQELPCLGLKLQLFNTRIHEM